MDENDPVLHLPAVMARNENIVRARFWQKLRKFVTQIPFAVDMLAAYYCAIDPGTPVRVKAMLLAALAYFVLPADIIPDFIAGFGFTDDAAVLLSTITMVGAHMNAQHREKAAHHITRLHDRVD